MGETIVQPIALNPNVCPGCPLSVLMIHSSKWKNNLSIMIIFRIHWILTLEEH